MAKRDETVAMRDAALAMIKVRGSMREAAGRRVLMADEGGLSFLLTTPFSRMPGPRAPRTYAEAAALQDYKDPLPYMIDVWAPRKVLSVSWDDAGAVCITNFKRGAWQAELVRLAEAVSAATGGTAAAADMSAHGGGKAVHGHVGGGLGASRPKGPFAVLMMANTVP